MKKSATSLIIGTLLLVVVQLVWVGTHEISKYILTDLRFKRPIFMSFVRSSMWACCLLLYFWRSRSEDKKQRKSWRDVLFYLVFFAPPWMMSSVIGQVSLLFTSVSATFLIGASTPLFVLLLGTFASRSVADHCSISKFLLVIVNLASVAVVSEFSPSALGSLLALVVAICNSIYLANVSSYKAKHGDVDLNLTIGTVGVLTLLVTIPLMGIFHATGIESQLPLPTSYELGLVAFTCFVGSVLMDYLWLYATVLTSSFISALSITLSIPLSMVADTVFRGEPPNMATVIASIPITLSFIAATLITTREESAKSEDKCEKPALSPSVTSVSSVSSEFDESRRESVVCPTVRHAADVPRAV